MAIDLAQTVLNQIYQDEWLRLWQSQKNELIEEVPSAHPKEADEAEGILDDFDIQAFESDFVKK